MKFFRYFWVAFASYFILIHPAIIYYNIPSGSPADKDPERALLYLAIAIVGWALVFLFVAFVIYKSTYGRRKNILKLLQQGRSVPATIVEVFSSNAVNNAIVQQKLTVSFTNFAKESVYHTIELNDSKPEMKRYGIGKKMRLCIDDTMRIPPYILPQDTQVKLNKKKLLLLTIIGMLLVFSVIAYFIYVYQTESQGYGWRFLDIYHPLLLSMFILIGTGMLVYLLLFKLLVPKLNGGKSRDKIALLLYGQKATARVMRATQTGAYINEQPEIKFVLSYTDTNGNIHQATLKKIVDLINLHQVQQPVRVIFYLPDSPEIVAFEKDIQSS